MNVQMISKDYFCAISHISNKNSASQNIAEVIKAVSYFTLVAPAVVGLTYCISALKNRIIRNNEYEKAKVMLLASRDELWLARMTKAAHLGHLQANIDLYEYYSLLNDQDTSKNPGNSENKSKFLYYRFASLVLARKDTGIKIAGSERMYKKCIELNDQILHLEKSAVYGSEGASKRLAEIYSDSFRDYPKALAYYTVAARKYPKVKLDIAIIKLKLGQSFNMHELKLLGNSHQTDLTYHAKLNLLDGDLHVLGGYGTGVDFDAARAAYKAVRDNTTYSPRFRHFAALRLFELNQVEDPDQLKTLFFKYPTTTIRYSENFLFPISSFARAFVADTINYAKKV